MKRIFLFLKRPWVIALIGLIALSALIWFGGPLIAIAGKVPLESATTRLVVIMVLVLLWGLNNLRVQRRANRAAQQVLGSAAGTEQPAARAAAPGKPSESEEEVATLKQRFEEAVQVLKKTHRGGYGKQFLYELPWYIIIGPPGAGKTTALTNSGLEFPLAEHVGSDPLRGVGGTRNCDWWFTNDAVLLDTAGRYTTQDSHEAVDSAAWTGFLDLLKRYRRRRPINGALVAISLSDLMVQSEAERSLHARAVRARLQELTQRLECRFPVYVLFTKADLVAGFTEFFDDLGREERTQVWGMTFPPEEGSQDAEGPVRHFAPEFDALLRRLYERLLERLHEERDLGRRALVHGFPQQVMSLKETAQSFLHEVFRPSRYEARPWLRGVYFTSGTQEGTPIDRIMGSLARTFGLERQALASFTGRGRSYFINRLLKDVVFAEAQLAGANLRFERQRTWMQRGAYAGALLLTAVAALGWFTSFTRNEMRIQAMDEDIAQYQTHVKDLASATSNFTAALPGLAAIRSAAYTYGDDKPLLMRLGLYQGDTLEPAAQGAYARVLRLAFLPRIVARLEEQLRGGSAHPEFLREALKVYLMLGDPQRLDPDLVRQWMRLDWQTTLRGQPAAQQALEQHLDALLSAGIDPVPLDARLVAQVRQRLTRLPLAQQIYAKIQQQAGASKLADFSLIRELGNPARTVFASSGLEHTIPGLYTYEGFHQFFLKNSLRLAQELTQETWVLGDRATTSMQGAADLKTVGDQVMELYLTDYARYWRELLSGLSIVPLRSLKQATEVLYVATGPSSPVRGVLQAVERNTTLTRLPKPSGLLGKAAEKVAGGKQDRLAQLYEQAQQAAPGLKIAPGEAVEKQFADLNSLVRSEPNSPAPLDAVINDLGDLYGFLNEVASNPDAGGSALSTAKQRMTQGGKDVIARLRQEAGRLPEPVAGWVEALAAGSWGLVVGSTRGALDAALRTDVLPLCQQGLMGRYPFVKDSPREATLEDFATFFGPGGTMDKFFQDNLAPFVDTTRPTWRLRSQEGLSLGLSGSTLRQFQRARLIRDTFFRGGGNQPVVRFGLRPVFLDANARQFLLELDGQQLVYRHDPPRTTALQWPGREAPGQVRVVFEDLNGSQASMSEDGPWAWFKVLDRAEVKPTADPDQFLVTFRVGGYKATFELRAASVVNPFRMAELEDFRCPQHL